MSYKSQYKPLDTYRKRQRYGPLIIGGLAIILVAVGITLVLASLNSSGPGIVARLFATDTPTPTLTPTSPPPTATATITLTPTITSTPTLAPSATASEPFEYRVEAGDNLSIIAEKFGLDPFEGVLTIMLLNGLSNSSVLFPNDVLIIPAPDTERPTATPIPNNLPAGFEIEYMVLPGDSLRIIAQKFFSTEDGIIEANDLENPNQIFVGDILLVPIRLITPTFGPSPTETVAATATPTPTSTP